jgi:NAD(P)-dependent dehydrogenase (short-subunit alcohol dehydrogenase family)
MAALAERRGSPIPREAVGRDVRRGAIRAPVGRLAREVVQHCRIGLTVSPEEIARVVAFLAADASAYITGQVWGVNGGLDM